MIEIDFNKKLEITIRNERPIVLTDLTLSLLAFTQQYQKFMETETQGQPLGATELYIKEVRSGSIVVELVAQAMPIVPLIWEGGPLSEWIKCATAIVEWLLGKRANPPKELTKNDLKQWHSIVEPIAKDNASQFNINVSDNGKVINQFIINSQEANALQNNIKRQLEQIESPDDHIQRRKVMYWYQSRFDAESHSGDRAIIEDITKKPIKIIFENNAVKQAMLAGDPKFNKPWHKLAYIVDVQVQTIEGAPKLYTVLKYYPEHTFDPED
ncbi:MAG: hypothetical protein AABZ84_09865 [Pseudomonadota bacterium]